MTIETATDLGRSALYVTLLVAMPAMVTGMIVGLTVSLFQSITSIQEQTLSFVPKILVTLAVVILALPWIMTHVTEFTTDLYLTIPSRF
ncbi:Flagellar biosynthetic protein FliQ [Planctomycetes bacterium Pan216]|uniref:Flagellar biosynthetic protein FliQ n=1 Tax=Kolteria novifilia TaxID=2527975 RepID=A0A518B963_9BACT|nr:Flagellar biosynthetic protein FliQ [Planctomycetes bacterium Pan216]